MTEWLTSLAVALNLSMLCLKSRVPRRCSSSASACHIPCFDHLRDSSRQHEHPRLCALPFPVLVVRAPHWTYMPRARLQRVPCDCADCREGGPPPPPAGAATAAARQAPPPKSLVICLSNVLQPGQDFGLADLPHLHAAVRAGWAGLLACRAGGPPLPLQVLGLPAAGVAPPQSLPDRCAMDRLDAGLFLHDCGDVLGMDLDKRTPAGLPPAPALPCMLVDC